MFYYDRTFVGSKCPVMSPENAPSKHVTVALGVALLAVPHLKSFRYDGQKWSLKGSSLGLWYLYPLIWIYILVNLFDFVVDWSLSRLQNTSHTKERLVASWVGPCVGTACFAAGAAY